MNSILDATLQNFLSHDSAGRKDRRALVQTFMLCALAQVRLQLPSLAQSALAVAESVFSIDSGAEVEEEARAALWTSIAGRDFESTPEVLRIRATICALYSQVGDVDPGDTLEYFANTFLRAGLEPEALKAAEATFIQAQENGS